MVEFKLNKSKKTSIKRNKNSPFLERNDNLIKKLLLKVEQAIVFNCSLGRSQIRV
jgi:hypothetical protein